MEWIHCFVVVLKVCTHSWIYLNSSHSTTIRLVSLLLSTSYARDSQCSSEGTPRDYAAILLSKFIYVLCEWFSRRMALRKLAIKPIIKRPLKSELSTRSFSITSLQVNTSWKRSTCECTPSSYTVHCTVFTKAIEIFLECTIWISFYSKYNLESLMDCISIPY